MNALPRRLSAALSLFVLSSSAAFAQDLAAPDIVVTPNRVPQPIQRAGSAVSVITAEEIERSSAKNVGDLLQQVPGVSVTQAGGPGRVETVRIRGGESRHTLVLVDGIRVNDPSTTGREFDFSALVLADIERIEVLRGPQSALYGSDAMGGVVNIITKRGRTGARASVEASYGSYNTKELRGSVSGGTERVYYSLGVTGLQTDGFSAYGARIPRITRLFPNLDDDGAARFGVTGRVGVHLTDTVTVEAGGSFSRNVADYDAAFLPFPDTPSVARADLASGYARLIHTGFEGTLRSTVTAFANQTNRRLKDYFAFGPGPTDYFLTNRRFLGERTGAEYQGDLTLPDASILTFGGKVERETARGSNEDVFPVPAPRVLDFRGEQVTRSAYLLYQKTFLDRLHLSLGGRFDDVQDRDRFVTGRATLAYEIAETGTKLRASAGSGAKAPSLYQLFSSYGTLGLVSEDSVGFDAGIDQRLFDDRLRLSAGAFTQRYRNLIDFDANPADCAPGQAFGCYFNVARARVDGLEFEAKATVSESVALRGSYTYLRSEDLATGLELARRPRHQGFLAVTLQPAPAWTLEPRLVLVGERFSSPNETDPLKPYARLDFYGEYRATDAVSLFVRAENLTGTRYQEVKDYGTAGRSIYGGVRVTW